MPGIRFEIGHFDHHPARFIRAVGADLKPITRPDARAQTRTCFLIGSVQRHRFTGTIKSLPVRMPGIRFEIGQFDHHPVRCAWAIGADLNAD
jgi:hypothetical protein